MHPMKMAATAAALGFLAVAPFPAAAQYGSAPPPPPPAAPPREAPSASTPATAAPAATPPGEVLRAAACAIGRDANSGNALLAAVPRSPEERTAAIAFLRVAERCLRLTTRISTSTLTLRGAVAESLYEAQFATPAAARNPAVGAAPLARPAASAEEIVAALAPMYALAECALPRQPDLVRALLATEPRTPEEQAALTALNPAIIACVPAGTTTVNIDPRAMRSMFAEGLYRWSVVQRDGPASPWAAAPPAPAPAPAPGG